MGREGDRTERAREPEPVQPWRTGREGVGAPQPLRTPQQAPSSGSGVLPVPTSRPARGIREQMIGSRSALCKAPRRPCTRTRCSTLLSSIHGKRLSIILCATWLIYAPLGIRLARASLQLVLEAHFCATLSRPGRLLTVVPFEEKPSTEQSPGPCFPCGDGVVPGATRGWSLLPVGAAMASCPATRDDGPCSPSVRRWRRARRPAMMVPSPRPCCNDVVPGDPR